MKNDSETFLANTIELMRAHGYTVTSLKGRPRVRVRVDGVNDIRGEIYVDASAIRETPGGGE